MNPLTFDGIEIDKSSKSKEVVIDLTIIIPAHNESESNPVVGVMFNAINQEF